MEHKKSTRKVKRSTHGAQVTSADVTREFMDLRGQFEAMGIGTNGVDIAPFIRWKAPEITDKQVRSLSLAFAGRCTKKHAVLIPVVKKVLQQLAA